MEIGQRGVFTVALLHILKTTRMDRTTYNQVVLDVSTEIRSKYVQFFFVETDKY